MMHKIISGGRGYLFISLSLIVSLAYYEVSMRSIQMQAAELQFKYGLVQ